MKACLVAVNSKYIHENLAVHSLRAFADRNVGTSGSTKTSVIGTGDDATDQGLSLECEISICEFTINQTQEYVLEKLYEDNADIYAFSVYIWNVSFVMRLIDDLSKVRPDAIIWAGGPEVSYDAKELLKEHQPISIVMRGEGEGTFAELMRTYATWMKEYYDSGDKRSRIAPGTENISGITYRDDNGSIVANVDRTPMDMDELAFPYEDAEFDPARIYYYESSRGCPYSCAYCLSSIDKRVRYRSTDTVKKELAYFISKDIRQVKFVDRTFNCDPRRAYELWQYIKDNDNGMTNFHFEVSADLLRDEDVRLLSTLRPGQVQLEIGVQTTNAETLEAIHRRTDWTKLSGGVRCLLHTHNIHIHLDLIAGLPYEDIRSFRRSFNDVYGLKPLQLQLGFLKVLKGTEMELMVNRYGDDYICSDYPPYEVLRTPWMPYEDMLILKGMTEMIELFYNSRQFENTLERLERCFDDYFCLYQELSQFYHDHHYDEARHARIKLYEIMLEFIDGCGLDRQEYVPLLLKDAYAREKLKHFPEWAKGYEHTVSFNYDRRDPLTYNAIMISDQRCDNDTVTGM